MIVEIGIVIILIVLLACLYIRSYMNYKNKIRNNDK